MKVKRIIQIGGVINLLFAAFHLSFWQLFDWQHNLATLSANDRAVMQVLNIHMAYVLLAFSILSLFFADEMNAAKLGRGICLVIAGFWILRSANQAAFWGLSSTGSWIISGACLAIAALYLVPATVRPGAANSMPREANNPN